MRCHLVLSLWLGLCFWTNGLAITPVGAAVLPSSTVRVPMRDGTLLATDVYLPAGNGPWPAALARTPFGRADFRKSSGGHGGIPSSRFLNAGIALVVQDVRGRFGSQGELRPIVNEGWGERQDGLDTVHWIR